MNNKKNSCYLFTVFFDISLFSTETVRGSVRAKCYSEG